MKFQGFANEAGRKISLVLGIYTLPLVDRVQIQVQREMDGRSLPLVYKSAMFFVSLTFQKETREKCPSGYCIFALRGRNTSF